MFRKPLSLLKQSAPEGFKQKRLPNHSMNLAAELAAGFAAGPVHI